MWIVQWRGQTGSIIISENRFCFCIEHDTGQPYAQNLTSGTQTTLSMTNKLDQQSSSFNRGVLKQAKVHNSV